MSLSRKIVGETVLRTAEGTVQADGALTKLRWSNTHALGRHTLQHIWSQVAKVDTAKWLHSLETAKCATYFFMGLAFLIRVGRRLRCAEMELAFTSHLRDRNLWEEPKKPSCGSSSLLTWKTSGNSGGVSATKARYVKSHSASPTLFDWNRLALR